jgi:hypothetical protein
MEDVIWSVTESEYAGPKAGGAYSTLVAVPFTA